MAGKSNNAFAYSEQTAARPAPRPSIQPKKDNVVSLPQREVPIYLFGRGVSVKALIQGVLVCAAMAVVIAIVVFNEARLDAVSSELANQKAMLQEAEQRYNQLSVDMQAKINIRDVERYANTELGMQLPERYQITIMGQPKEDKVVIGEADEQEKN